MYCQPNAGQVQDVGLIFISAMATDVVARCMAAGAAPAATLATTLVTLTLATGVVGALIVAVGALKLASLVQFVPLPVVGGEYKRRAGWDGLRLERPSAPCKPACLPAAASNCLLCYPTHYSNPNTNPNPTPQIE